MGLVNIINYLSENEYCGSFHGLFYNEYCQKLLKYFLLTNCSKSINKTKNISQLYTSNH